MQTLSLDFSFGMLPVETDHQIYQHMEFVRNAARIAARHKVREKGSAFPATENTGIVGRWHVFPVVGAAESRLWFDESTNLS